jgi:predicted small secreted protein
MGSVMRDSRGNRGVPGRVQSGMTAPRRFSLGTVSVALAALALAGCGTQHGDGTPAGGGGPAGGGTVTTTTPAPALTLSGGPTKGVPQGTAVTVEGVIEQGVEPGCYVLTPTGGGEKYLVMGQSKPPVEVKVRVSGVTQPGTMSYCQQGTPLKVSTVERVN